MRKHSVVDRNSRYLFYGEDAPYQRPSLTNWLSSLGACIGVIMLAIGFIQVLKRLKKLEAKDNEKGDDHSE